MRQGNKHIAILVNLSANDGKASDKWEMIRESVLNQLGKKTLVHVYQPPEDITEILHYLTMKEGDKLIISAGGDGSINHIVNILMQYPHHFRESITLGTIGLGSSNDTLKPFTNRIAGIPVNINPEKAINVDIGMARINQRDDSIRYFLNNASIGVTAYANALFNAGDAFIRATKKKWTTVAILYAAIKTILNYKNVPARINYCNGWIESDLSGISIIKTPFLAGMLRYDQDIRRNDGWLGINLCENMNRKELLRTVYQLARGHFQNLPKCTSLRSAKIYIETKKQIPAELDGEICFGKSFEFFVRPAALRVICSH